MSNYDEEEIEIELDFEEGDLEVSGTFSEPIEMEVIDELDFILEDEIDVDELIDSLHDSTSFLDKSDESNDLLFLDMEEIEIDTEHDPFAKTKYEVSLTPAQNAVAIYKPRADEAFELEVRNKEIHDSIRDVSQYAREANKKIREYLESPKFDFIPKFKFKSEHNKGEQDFRSLLISLFNNHRSVPDLYTEKNIIEKVIGAYYAERYPEMDEQETNLMITLIKDFLIFANSKFDEASRATVEASFKPLVGEVICPESIGNKTYVCKCGEEYEMPEGRPTLTFLIKQVTGAASVRFMNTPIPCPKCEVYLALPTTLADMLELNVSDYVQTIKATYETPRIYRPKIEDLENMIPTDVADLFQLRTTNVVDSSVAINTSSSTLSSYKKLVNMWMNTVISTSKLEKVVNDIVDKEYLEPITNQITRVDFGFVTDVYSHQFLKTLLHYLEGDSLFSLTYDSKAFYEFCALDGYSNKPFPVDFAVNWLKENAVYLASLNNLYNGDMSVTNIDILPEYVEVLNYIIGLHMLANPKLLKKGSMLGKWYDNPAGSKKPLMTYYESKEVSKKKQISSSARDLLNSNHVIDPLCWKDSYYFFKQIALPNRFEVEPSEKLNALLIDTRKKSIEEFYGVEVLESTMIRPVYYFEEFMEALNLYGHKLFSGVIVDEVRKNLAIGIENIIEMDKIAEQKAKGTSKSFTSNLSQNFKSYELPVADVANVFVKAPTKKIDFNALLMRKMLSSAELPSDLSEKRDTSGVDFILDNYDDYRESIQADQALMSKFGEVISCY